MPSKKLHQRIFRIMTHIIKKELHPKNTVTFMSEVDATVINEMRNQYLQENGFKPSYTSFVVQAVAQAVEKHPHVNARIFPKFFYKAIHQFQAIDIAVASEKDFSGAEFFTFMDIIKDANKASLAAIQRQLVDLATSDENTNQQLKDFVNLARWFPSWFGKQLAVMPSYSAKLWERYRGAGIMISSPAKYGVDGVAATWTHPIGISFGLVRKKAFVKNGELQPVLSFTLTLNFDRRIIAGAPAARFFHEIVENLQRPKKGLNVSKEREVQQVA